VEGKLTDFLSHFSEGHVRYCISSNSITSVCCRFVLQLVQHI